MKICQETIIILHGWQSSKEKWQIFKEKIEKQSEDRPRPIRVVVPDLPGFKKETQLDRVWDLDDYINWLENFCSEITEPFYLLGHSFGGRMAIKFAVKHPERLKGLILVSAAGLKKREEKNLFRRPFCSWGELTFYAGVKIFSSIFKLPILKKVRSFLRKIFYRYILRKTDYINAEKMPYLQETFKNIITEDLTSYLSHIKTSTLIIWGNKDKMTPLSDAYLMKERIKGSELEILKNVAHTPHLEKPEILAQKIMNFIKK